MTLADIKLLIDTNIPDNTTGLITPAKERQVMKAIADFVVSSQGESDTAPFVYDPAFSYAIDAPVIYDAAWYLSLAAANLNNQPDISALKWQPVNAFNTVLSIWELDAVYLGELTIVIKDNKLYLLDRNVVGTGPFVSSNFATELSAGKWINLLPNSTPVANTYADTTAMIAAQSSQVSGYFYFAGSKLYVYLGTTAGNLTDYYAVEGATGAKGWSPILAVVVDGERRVHQVTDWTGGEGTKPATGQFIGPLGLVATAAEATDIRGTTGTNGLDINWRGQWLTATVYAINDAVFNLGSSYIAKTAHTSASTTEPGVGVDWATVWDLMAQKGNDGAGGPDNYTPQTGTVLAFDGPNKYGFNGTPLTANLTFSITGAKETVMIKARHNAGTAPTLTPPGGVTLLKEGADYTVSVDNILYAICHKNDAGTVTHISYSWTKNQA